MDLTRPTLMRMGRHLLLALAMLLMQQAGLRHSLEHDAHEDAAPAHTACLLCMAHHAQGSPALGGTPPALPVVQAGHVLCAPAGQVQPGGAASIGYLSRAPPLRLSA